jgi:hypothetical protein
VCGRARRALGGGRSELQDGLGVAGGLGMMGDPGGVRLAPGPRECPHCGPMKLARAVGSDRALDGKPGELVPEANGAVLGHQHSRGQARVQVRAVRPSTASRTVAGISVEPVASTSVTKNGFPLVIRYSSRASTP